MFSEPVVGEKFFGRAEVLEALNKRASAFMEGYRQNIALTGQSLVGKSSIIHHFLHTTREEGYIPVYVEVVKEPFGRFAKKFIATMLYNSLIKMGENVSVDLDELLERSCAVLPKTSAAIKAVNSCIDRNDVDEAYSRLLGLTSVLKEDARLPCIVILDEFDNLESLGIRNPFLSFGKVIMVQKDTMYIVSSSRDQAIKKILSEKLSLLFGNFEILKIASFDAGASHDYIRSKLGEFDIKEGLEVFLAAFTGGNPFYLTKIVSSVARIARERMSSYIDEEIIADAVVRLVYDSSGVIHQYLLNFILELVDSKSRDSAIAVLLAIANGSRKHTDIAKSARLNKGEAAKLLARLTELALISKAGVFYRMDDVMLGFWLAHVYQKKRDLLVDGPLDKPGIFKEAMLRYIAGFEAEQGASAVSRIAELFNLFSNEMVEVDSKNMRLPHFTRVEIKAPSAGQAPLIVASFRGKYWIVAVREEAVSENDVVAYLRAVKELDRKTANKLILPLKGIDENARLLAKELKISIWELPTVNALLDIYNKRKIIII